MGGRHASCDIGPRHHNHVSLTLPDFDRSRAKSSGVLQWQECQYLHPLSLSAPSMITYSCTPCWLLGDQADREHSSSNHWSSGECRLYSNAPGGYRQIVSQPRPIVPLPCGLGLPPPATSPVVLSRPARVRRVAWTILFGLSMSFMSRASFCSAKV